MATIHATAVLIGSKAVLVRGPSGSGKSRLALDLIAMGETGLIHFARLVADDRVILSVHGDRLVAAAPAALAGLVERRGQGIVHQPAESCAVVGLVVDLDAEDAGRMPEPGSSATALCGVTLPRLPVARGADALRLVLARSSWASTANPVLAASHPYRYS
jgi:serine kinase of HPr protein (carbohydrate metabolism regulator)